MAKCKVTVLRRTCMDGIFDEYTTNPEERKCPIFKDAQEFVIDDPSKIPEGFCAYAWGDISRDMVAIMYGANIPWINKKNIGIVCCTDGLKPVVFKLEMID